MKPFMHIIIINKVNGYCILHKVSWLPYYVMSDTNSIFTIITLIFNHIAENEQCVVFEKLWSRIYYFKSL